MNEIRRRISEALESNDIGIDSKSTIMEALEKLSVYHEELRFQNDELKRANALVENLQKEYESLFTEAPVPYLLLNEKFEIQKFNNASRKLFGTSKLLGVSITKFIAHDSQDDIYHLKRKMVAGEEYEIKINLNILDEIRNFKIFANIINFMDKAYCRVTLLDQTQIYQQMEEIRYLSFKDKLTGAYNRNFFNEELKRLDNKKNFPVGVVMADLNGLKLVNDAFGHHFGDKLLKQTVSMLKSGLRGDDIIARIGGDEFVMILPRVSELEIKKIIKRMKKISEGIGVRDIKLSVAYGYSIKKSEGNSLESFLKEAENNMYKDKIFNQTSQRKSVINSIIATLHEKHPREEEHSKRVSDYSQQVGKALGYNNEKLINIKTAGMLHDIGKIAIDYSILDKPCKLDEVDYNEIKKHPEIGYRILSSSGIFTDISEIVLMHHENIDGTGYPRELNGGEIMEEAKILSVCDAYDAMTSDRAYRNAMCMEEAIEELKKGKGTQFDPEITDVFIKCIQN
ncbi:HD domain-containing phosphohydrolase [uncultured Ilyobacter sp.]|uniref:HD domain-containing phosphohydrolase n=1 Tax=uncultured Ilyobacter sp. TaxID=544433 RepID=UPI0029C068CF|nr:HD domain-containing phosphohydrolase [uncultured Ilyobacter sp.]